MSVHFEAQPKKGRAPGHVAAASHKIRRAARNLCGSLAPFRRIGASERVNRQLNYLEGKAECGK